LARVDGPDVIDVTDVPGVSLDDQVTLLGRAGELAITSEDVAKLAGTISYEIAAASATEFPGSISINMKTLSNSLDKQEVLRRLRLVKPESPRAGAR